MTRLRWLLLLTLPGTILHAADAPFRPDRVVASYATTAHEQKLRLLGASMDVEISASLPKLHKRGRLRALRRISRLGRITYEALRFDGDSTVKSNVIVRYLTAEAQPSTDSLDVLPENYKFKYKGRLWRSEGTIYVFEVTPKKKRVGLFKGELWLDAQAILPVRESGRFVKSPSVFVSRVEFVREYQIRDGLSIPTRIRSTVDTRLVGKAELTVDFRNVALAEDSVAAGSESGSE
jgi:hypothetical protein